MLAATVVQNNRIDYVDANLIHDRNQTVKRLVVTLKRGVLALLESVELLLDFSDRIGKIATLFKVVRDGLDDTEKGQAILHGGRELLMRPQAIVQRIG